MIHFALWIAALLFLCYLVLLVISAIASIIASISDASFWRKHHRVEGVRAAEERKRSKPTGSHVRVISTIPNK